MESTLHRTVQVYLTNKEVEDLLLGFIFTKHPELANNNEWSFEDCELTWDASGKNPNEHGFYGMFSSTSGLPIPKSNVCPRDCSCRNSSGHI